MDNSIPWLSVQRGERVRGPRITEEVAKNMSATSPNTPTNSGPETAGATLSNSLAVVPGAVRPKREDIPPGASLCEYCTGKCCQYIALPIETPNTWKDYDDLRWYLAHQDISVFVEVETWYLLVHRRCNHLMPDHRCGIYANRPQICRDYKTDGCEYDEGFLYDKLFEHDDQIWEYAEAILGPKAPPTPSLAIV